MMRKPHTPKINRAERTRVKKILYGGAVNRKTLKCLHMTRLAFRALLMNELASKEVNSNSEKHN